MTLSSSTLCASSSSDTDKQSGHTPLTIEELIQNVVEANLDVFPNNARPAVDNAVQNGCGDGTVSMEADSLPPSAAVDVGVALSDGMDLSELEGECGSVSSNAVLATLRSLVEVMNCTGLEGGAAERTEQMETWSSSPQEDGELKCCFLISLTRICAFFSPPENDTDIEPGVSNLKGSVLCRSVAGSCGETLFS